MNKEDNYVKNRLLDLADITYSKNIYAYSDFLNLNEINIFNTITNQLPPVNYYLTGGNVYAERKIVVFKPIEVYYEEDVPITLLKIEPLNKKYAYTLNHRDYLGALLNLGIDRSKIGDIFIGENVAYIYVITGISDYIINNFTKVKHTLISCKIAYDEIENVIAFSVRMNLNYDCLRSIAFELNNGLKFQEAINDLNIIRISQYKNIKIIVEFENQATLSGKIKEWQLYDNTITDMSIYLPDNILPLSYVGEYIGEFPMNFSNNYIDKDKRMLMFHVTNPEPEYDIAYTHESQDEEKTDEGKKITDILDKLYIGQKIKRIYAVPSDQKDKFRFF